VSSWRLTDSRDRVLMAVAEELRGRGVGRELLNLVIADVRSIGATRLYLETAVSWKCRSLVRRSGVPTGPAERQQTCWPEIRKLLRSAPSAGDAQPPVHQAIDHRRWPRKGL
jgi:GNAT superfamily N-acetyltransferase